MVAWNALPAILPELGTSVGGLETHAWTLANGLRQYTSLVPRLFVRTSLWSSLPSEISGVQLYYDRQWLRSVRNQFSRAVHIGPPLRIIHWHPNLCWQFPLLATARLINRWRGYQNPEHTPATSPDPRLLDQNCQAWAAFGVNADSARVAATAAEQGRPLVLFLESNADLDARILTAADDGVIEHTNSQSSTAVHNVYGESFAVQRFALQTATTIVCQSQFQQRRLAQLFSIQGPVIRNPIDPAQWRPDPKVQRTYVLWIGRYDSFHKRIQLAFEVARQSPRLNFRMIVNRHDDTLEARLRSQRPANVELVDYVPFSEMPREFARAQAFLCTGSPDHEGFPNVLLQAAASHTPTCSLADFDDFLATSGAGVHCQDSVEQAAACLQSGELASQINWTQVDDYLAQHHSLPAIARQTNNLLSELMVGKP
jgi:glycosyltransferase involved in cell wall biosynthesis